MNGHERCLADTKLGWFQICTSTGVHTDTICPTLDGTIIMYSAPLLWDPSGVTQRDAELTKYSKDVRGATT